MAAVLLSFFRSLLPRRMGVPTMHSLRLGASGHPGAPSCGSFSRTVQQRPLRVVRAAPGRLVISGRMADVCAELDRLAALEAAAH
jgi:hypothetical protein